MGGRPARRGRVDQEDVEPIAIVKQVGGVGAIGGLQGGGGVDLIHQRLEKGDDGGAGLGVGDGDRHLRAVGFNERHLQPVAHSRIIAGLHDVVAVGGAIQERGLRRCGKRGQGRGRANGRAGLHRNLAAQRGHGLRAQHHAVAHRVGLHPGCVLPR